MESTEAAFNYSIRIAEIARHLRSEDKRFPHCDELLKCGMDAGVSLRDPPDAAKAVDCQNRADYPLEMATAGYLTGRQTERMRKSVQKLILKARTNL